MMGHFDRITREIIKVTWWLAICVGLFGSSLWYKAKGCHVVLLILLYIWS